MWTGIIHINVQTVNTVRKRRGLVGPTKAPTAVSSLYNRVLSYGWTGIFVKKLDMGSCLLISRPWVYTLD